MGELEATVQLDAPLEQTSIMTRTYNVHYSGHILVTSVNGWQSVGDLRSHIAALVGVPAYNIQLFVMGCGQGQFRVIECKHLNSDEGTLDNEQYKNVTELIAVQCDTSVPHIFVSPLVAGVRPVYCIPTNNISTVLELMQSIQYLTGIGEMRIVGHMGELDGKDLDEELLLVQYRVKPGQVFLFVDLYGHSQL